jgi:Ca-activated chloride channel family protein
VEHIWARRKVGYLLDQIRANGEKKELVDETVALAKRYGIATPYTSYLIVPDAPVPVVNAGLGGRVNQFSLDARPQGRGAGMPGSGGIGGGIGGGLRDAPNWGTAFKTRGGAPAGPAKVADLARSIKGEPGGVAQKREVLAEQQIKDLEKESKSRVGHEKEQAPDNGALYLGALQAAGDKKGVYDRAKLALAGKDQLSVQSGELGVDLSIDANNLRNQVQLTQTACRNVNGRNCLEVGGIWIDEQFNSKVPVLIVKAQSTAYFRMLERHPKVKDVFKLGNYLVWVTPSGTALVVDSNDGKDKLTDEEIDKLFVMKK